MNDPGFVVAWIVAVILVLILLGRTPRPPTA